MNNIKVTEYPIGVDMMTDGTINYVMGVFYETDKGNWLKENAIVTTALRDAPDIQGMIVTVKAKMDDETLVLYKLMFNENSLWSD